MSKKNNDTLDKKKAAIEVWKHANTAYLLGLVGMIGGLIALLVCVVSATAGVVVFLAASAYIAWNCRKEKQYMLYLQDKYKIDTKARF